MNHHEDVYDLTCDEDEEEEEEDEEEDDDEMEDDDNWAAGHPATGLTDQERNNLAAARAAPEVEAQPLLPAAMALNAHKKFEPSATHCLGTKREALCLSISQDRSVLAVGSSNGRLLTLHPQTLELHQELELDHEPGQCTAARFRPDLPSSSTKHVVLATKGSNVHHVHATSGHLLHTASEEGNTIHAIQTREDGAMFATAGTDRTVRIYDEATRRVLCKLKDGDGINTCGHTNNIYSLAWKSEDWQVLATAGWDNTVQLWDIREGKSVRSIYGPYVAGDALDLKGQTVLTGSWRHNNPLQMWDYGSGKLMTNLPWQQLTPDGTLLYAAKYGQDNLSSCIFSCGSGKAPMLRAHNKDGTMIGSMPLPSAGHAVEATTSKTGDTVHICCAFHVLKWDMAGFA